MLTKRKYFILLITALLIISIITPIFAGEANYILPVTGKSVLQKTNKSNAGKIIAEVTVPGVLSYQVVQSGNNVPTNWSIGQYAYASNKGALGLLAHNYLAGRSFFSLYPGLEITVTYDNGNTQIFVIKNILRYKASNPDDFSKSFITNNGEGKKITAKSVFNQAYKQNWVTFQTCISAEGSTSWGLLFVQAVPK